MYLQPCNNGALAKIQEVGQQSRRLRVALATASNITNMRNRSLLERQMLQVCKGLHNACEGQTAGISQFACTYTGLISLAYAMGDFQW